MTCNPGTPSYFLLRGELKTWLRHGNLHAPVMPILFLSGPELEPDRTPPPSPPAGERVNARWPFHNTDHYSVKWDELLTHVRTRMILTSTGYMKEGTQSATCCRRRTDQWFPGVRGVVGGSHFEGTGQEHFSWQGVGESGQ